VVLPQPDGPSRLVKELRHVDELDVRVKIPGGQRGNPRRIGDGLAIRGVFCDGHGPSLRETERAKSRV
jgi:hypothetical protein